MARVSSGSIVRHNAKCALRVRTVSDICQFSHYDNNCSCNSCDFHHNFVGFVRKSAVEFGVIVLSRRDARQA